MKAFLGRYWHYLIVVGVTLLLNVLHVASFTEFSPIDESRHVDYIVHLKNGHVVALGDALDPETMRLEACRGIDLPGFDEPPCDATSYIPPQFRDAGYNNAVNHPPLYYGVTAVPAWIADKLGAGIFDPARLFGGVWLAVGVVLAMRAAELLGAKRLPVLGAALALTVVPGIVSTHATVNSDAAGIFAGGLVFLLAVLWEQGRVSTRWLVVGGVVAGGLKLTNLAAIAVVVLWFLMRALARRREMALDDDDDRPSTRDARAYLVGAATLLLAAVAVSGVWLGIQGARATIDPLELESNRRFQVEHFPGDELFLPDNLFAMMPPLGHNTYVSEPLKNRLIEDVDLVGLALAVTAIVGWALRFSVRDRLSTIGVATLAACVAGPTVFIVFSWITAGLAYGPSSRYALSIVPFVIALLATLVRGRVATWGLVGYAFVAVGVTAGVLIHG